MFLADSLISGFMASNMMGKGIVLVQLAGSVVMLAVIIGKARELSFVAAKTRQFIRDFTSGRDVLDYYLQRRQSAHTALEVIYTATCERLLKLLTPDVRSLLVGRKPGSAAALSSREIELVRSTCEHTLDEEEIRIESGMGVIATVVALSPMLGLLGTVWGVLDAFADMGSAGTATIATMAPAISSALVTTVVGLLIAIPGLMAYNRMSASVRNMTSEMEGFADELTGRIACEFQGRAE